MNKKLNFKKTILMTLLASFNIKADGYKDQAKSLGCRLANSLNINAHYSFTDEFESSLYIGSSSQLGVNYFVYTYYLDHLSLSFNPGVALRYQFRGEANTWKDFRNRSSFVLNFARFTIPAFEGWNIDLNFGINILSTKCELNSYKALVSIVVNKEVKEGLRLGGSISNNFNFYNPLLLFKSESNTGAAAPATASAEEAAAAPATASEAK